MPKAYFLFLANFRLENYEDSKKNIANAIALDPENAEYIFLHGKNEEELNNFKDAIEDYTEAISIDPRQQNIFIEEQNQK